MFFDIVIKNAKVIKGDGSPYFLSDIGINKDKITAIGKNLTCSNNAKRIDATNLFLSPGFIDIHTHSDLAPLIDPLRIYKISQGINTEVTGNCGLGVFSLDNNCREAVKLYLTPVLGNYNSEWSWSSWDDYSDLIKGKINTNFIFLLPYFNLRTCFNGFKKEMDLETFEKIKKRIREGMEFGAAGLSFGLNLTPMNNIRESELEEIFKIVASHNKFIAVHLRSYREDFFKSLSEIMKLCKKTKVSLQLSHYHTSHSKNYGKADRMKKVIYAYREQGLDITMDIYPYISGCGALHGILPRWIWDEGISNALKKLKDKNIREKILEDIEVFLNDNREKIYISGVKSKKNKYLEGKSLKKISEIKNMGLVDIICDLLYEEELGVSFIVFHGNENDIEELIKSDLMMVGSDGVLFGEKLHPRENGAFSRYLKKYVREKRILTLEEAVRRITSLPAKKIGIKDRGIIDIGNKADVVIFDINNITDTATFSEPKQMASGMKCVIINGNIVFANGKTNFCNAGQVIKIS